jgi:ring-1,2-phenylacetyl-CoA epoxidase subunit PaaD
MTITEQNIDTIWSILATVNDPEIPVLSILDLGIVRDVAFENGAVHITITPTYTGCPAMDAISMNIRLALLKEGFSNIQIHQALSPVWTTDWITENGKQQLQVYGIAAPVGKSIDQQFLEDITVPCPQCNSNNTVLISQFGSTACKALFKCDDCKEPFDYFKCH